MTHSSASKSLALSLALLAGCSSKQAQVTPPPQPRSWQAPPAQQNPIPAENALAGDAAWATAPDAPGEVELYLDRVSARAGDAVQVMAGSKQALSGQWTLYRLGWYGGAGARNVLSGGGLALAPQASCPIDVASGQVRCAWTKTFSFTVPESAVSGLYLVKIVRSDGRAAFAPLVVRDARPASLLFQSSVTTAQAYNGWEGESLYEDDGHGSGGMATRVSFDRPYLSDAGTGQVLRYEALFARFLERNGYDVTYTTNLDVAREGAGALIARGAFLSVGHDEYWPPQERDAVEAARDAGAPALFFGANVGYWKVRLEDPGPDGNARTIVCYKQRPDLDPDQGPGRTGRYRDSPESRPENALVSVMYESWVLVAHAWTVLDPTHFLYAGTGLGAGDTVPQLVGYEYDRGFSAPTPGAAQTAARSPVVDAEGVPGVSEAASYRAPSGALVFGAGTIYWSLGLDGYQRDPHVERMTANVLHEALQLPVPAALAAAIAPMPGAQSAASLPAAQLVAQGLAAPAGVALLPSGALAIADPRAQQIFLVPASGAAPVAIAGDGHNSGSAQFDDVPGLKARFFGPTGLAALPDGTLFVADTHNDAIRRIDPGADHHVTTFAGALLQAGFADGPGPTARFYKPMGLAYDAPRARLLVADSAGQTVRAIDVATGTVTTLAGSGTGGLQDGPGATARFDFPTAVAASDDGRVFVVSSGDSTLKVIEPDAVHTVTTLVYGGPGYLDGPGTSARLLPQGGLVWSGGTLYVSDPGNGRIRLVTPGVDAASTSVATFAGNGRASAADPSSLGLPLGLALSANSVLAVDAATGTVRALAR